MIDHLLNFIVPLWDTATDPTDIVVSEPIRNSEWNSLTYLQVNKILIQIDAWKKENKGPPATQISEDCRLAFLVIQIKNCTFFVLFSSLI